MMATCATVQGTATGSPKRAHTDTGGGRFRTGLSRGRIKWLWDDGDGLDGRQKKGTMGAADRRDGSANVWNPTEGPLARGSPTVGKERARGRPALGTPRSAHTVQPPAAAATPPGVAA